VYILDTDIVSLLHEGRPKVIERLKECRGVDTVATTIITRVEILGGRFAYLLKASGTEQILKAQRLLRLSQAKLNDLPTAWLDDESLQQFAGLE
jgi:predicted nucleic acid-binding protein